MMIIIIIKLRTKTWPNEIGCKKDSVASASSWKPKFFKNILITPKCNWPFSYLQNEASACICTKMFVVVPMVNLYFCTFKIANHNKRVK